MGSLVFCVGFYKSLFVLFHLAVVLSVLLSIYGFWLPLCYLQTLPYNTIETLNKYKISDNTNSQKKNRNWTKCSEGLAGHTISMARVVICFIPNPVLENSYWNHFRNQMGQYSYRRPYHIWSDYSRLRVVSLVHICSYL